MRAVIMVIWTVAACAFGCEAAEEETPPATDPGTPPAPPAATVTSGAQPRPSATSHGGGAGDSAAAGQGTDSGDAPEGTEHCPRELSIIGAGADASFSNGAYWAQKGSSINVYGTAERLEIGEFSKPIGFSLAVTPASASFAGTPSDDTVHGSDFEAADTLVLPDAIGAFTVAVTAQEGACPVQTETLQVKTYAPWVTSSLAFMDDPDVALFDSWTSVVKEDRSTGNIYTLMLDTGVTKRLRVRKSTDFGATSSILGHADNISDMTTMVYVGMDLAVDGDVPYVVYRDAESDPLKVMRYTGNTTTDGDGAPNDGWDFLGSSIVSGQAVLAFDMTILPGTGKPVVAYIWVDASDGNKRKVSAYRWNGANWVAFGTTGHVVADASHYALGVEAAPNGDLYLATWKRYDDVNPNQLSVFKSTDHVSWTVTSAAAPNLGESQDFDAPNIPLFFDANSTPYLVHQQGGTGVRVRRYDALGDVWSHVGLTGASVGFVTQDKAVLAFDAAATPYLYFRRDPHAPQSGGILLKYTGSASGDEVGTPGDGWVNGTGLEFLTAPDFTLPVMRLDETSVKIAGYGGVRTYELLTD